MKTKQNVLLSRTKDKSDKEKAFNTMLMLRRKDNKNPATEQIDIHEEIDIFAQSIVIEFSAAINSLLESDSQVQNASIIINDDIDFMSDMSFGMEFRDSTAVKRILQTVADKLNNNGLAYNDTVLNAEATFESIDQPSAIMPDAAQHDEDGYIAAVDHTNQTLWIFFYDNAEESATIMRHIRKDLLVFQNIQ